METAQGPIRSRAPTAGWRRTPRPGHPDRPIALRRRDVHELLAEELRRLDEDDIYAAVASDADQEQVAVTAPGTPPRVEVHESAGRARDGGGGRAAARLADAQSGGGEPHIALTGGSIADAVHRELARLSPGSEVDWSRVVVWWGDERFVAPDVRRPQRAARPGRRFLDQVGVDPAKVHEMPSTSRRRGRRRRCGGVLRRAARARQRRVRRRDARRRARTATSPRCSPGSRSSTSTTGSPSA